jgi:uncharacterized protein with ParB-like and HNH nuclease domain
MSILPQKRDITALFSIGKPYYIDFYQRDYKWKKEHINKLLEDLFYRFNQDYHADIDIKPEVISKYDWYYLNTYVTNVYGGNSYIVDGQQRFTSLALILIKLYHLTQSYPELKHLSEFISDRVAGRTPTGREYWMGQNGRKEVLENLFNDDNARINYESVTDLSVKNMYQNYSYIDQELSSELTDAHKLQAFSLWFLQNVMLVQIEIPETKDVPMVFEVINDRGERLKPYEVLKGKLLGQIQKEEIDTYHSIWQEHIHTIQDIDENLVDDFFRTFFRAKYVATKAEYAEFDGDYHKIIYEPKWNSLIKLKQNAKQVKRFITDDLHYYADLFTRVSLGSLDIDSGYGPYLFFNDINGQDRQVLLILSACNPNDDKEQEKITTITKLFDRHFSLLQLSNSYNSNDFTDSLIILNEQIRGKSAEEIDQIYNQRIVSDISTKRGMRVADPYDWGLYKDIGKLNLGDKFIRYFFARIEHFIAEHTKLPTDGFNNLARNTGPVNGYHIEHVLANNDENRALFGDDEELFTRERNKLGALLLLRGRDNEASNNESYAEKVKTYAHSLLWNQTLHPDFKHKNKGLEEFDKAFDLGLSTYGIFDSNAINARQQILWKLIRIIW